MRLKYIAFKLHHSNIGKIIDEDNPKGKAFCTLVSKNNANLIIKAIEALKQQGGKTDA